MNAQAGLPLIELKKARIARSYKGHTTKITHICYPSLRVGPHTQTSVPLFVTQLASHQVLLGKRWGRLHGLVLDMGHERIWFEEGFCKHEGAVETRISTPLLFPHTEATPESQMGQPAPAPALVHEIQSLSGPHQGISSPVPSQRPVTGPRTPEEADILAPRPKLPRKILSRPSQSTYQQQVQRDMRIMNLELSKSDPRSESPRDTRATRQSRTEMEQLSREMGAAFVSAPGFRMTMKRKDVEIFSITMKEFIEYENFVGGKNQNQEPELPPELADLAHVFSEEASDKLNEHSEFDHRIKLVEGKTRDDLKSFPLREYSPQELAVIKHHLQELLRKDFVRASTAAFNSPVLLARKKGGGGLRFCVDYRKLNDLTEKDKYPIPLIEETLARLKNARIFTKLDIRQAFHRVRMDPSSEDLTTFKTRYGTYCFKVLPFGLTNGPATFQHFINETLMEYLDDFCSAYLDDILIYSEDPLEHMVHVRKVLERLEKAGLQCDLKKCQFSVTRTKFLGLIITTEGIEMDPEKVTAVMEWSNPRNLKDVRRFLGFCNYYRRFIRGFSKVAKPLTALTRKDYAFQWTPKEQEAFQALKDLISERPVLRHYDHNKPAVLEVDASDWATGGVLLQEGEDGQLHPVAFFSKNLSPAEVNYDIYDKELLAIIRALEEWRPELEGTQDPVKIFSDHKNLEYFMSTKKLSRRQARWAEFLSAYHFKIVYRPGKMNDSADGLSRRPNDVPAHVEDERLEQMNQTILTPDRLLIEIHAVDDSLTLPEAVSLANKHNADLDGQRRKLRLNPNSRTDYQEKEGLLFYRNRLCVPANDKALILRILKEFHDQPAVGHRGIRATIGLIQRGYHWTGLPKDVRKYVAACLTCQRNKPRNRGAYGLLKPLPIPFRPWTDLSVDFISGLPTCEGFNAIMVVVDRLSKMRHYVACTKDTDAREMAKLFIRDIWKYHGLPDSIVSDRGGQFISAFWTELCRLLQIQRKLSTAHHPQTDGQTENANRSLLAWLRKYVNYHQDNWIELLPMAEFADNEIDSESSGVSPFFANYGFHPRMSFDSTGTPDPPKDNNERKARIDAADMANRMNDIWTEVRDALRIAQAKQAKAADQHRTPAPFAVGDKVLVSSEHLTTNRPNKKLDHRFLGPYPITGMKGSSYEIELPQGSRAYNVFHADKLRPVPTETFPGQKIDDPGPVLIADDGEPEWEVEKILDCQMRGRAPWYRVKWKDYPEPDDNYYPASDFENAPHKLRAYHDAHPDRGRPPRILNTWIKNKEKLDEENDSDSD